ncbi:MAG: response regulator [Candidatus Eisenbacteria bacterium]|nr:response regulator [Candidatus Eisenbacteria bacterium]
MPRPQPEKQDWERRRGGEATEGGAGEREGRSPIRIERWMEIGGQAARAPKRPTLLVVDDDPHLRRLYLEELAEEGYEVSTAASGEEAIRRFAHAPTDALVLDVRLSGMNGLDVMRQVLALRPATKVILNSAYGGYRSDFGSWAADRYVVKSSDLSELKGAVRDALGRAREGRRRGDPPARKTA